MASALALSVVDCEFEPRRVKPDYKSGIYCFPTNCLVVRAFVAHLLYLNVINNIYDYLSSLSTGFT